MNEAENYAEPGEVNITVPCGEWIDVPKGMVIAPDTRPYPGYPGVLQSVADGSVVCWHLRNCERRGIGPDEVVFDNNKAAWCPDCARVLIAKVVESQQN